MCPKCYLRSNLAQLLVTSFQSLIAEIANYIKNVYIYIEVIKTDFNMLTDSRLTWIVTLILDFTRYQGKYFS